MGVGSTKLFQITLLLDFVNPTNIPWLTSLLDDPAPQGFLGNNIEPFYYTTPSEDRCSPQKKFRVSQKYDSYVLGYSLTRISTSSEIHCIYSSRTKCVSYR